MKTSSVGEKEKKRNRKVGRQEGKLLCKGHKGEEKNKKGGKKLSAKPDYYYFIFMVATHF